MAQELDGRVALVTGAGGDFGSAIAGRLLQAGHRVIVNDVNPERAHAVGDELRKLYGDEKHRVEVLVADVSDATQVEGLFKRTAEVFGGLDVLVNNAAVVTRSPLKFHTTDEWHRVLRVNLDSVFFCSRAAITLMLPRRWGRIINISSVLGLSGGEYEIAYATSKAGVIGFTKSLAREVGRRMLCVNAICPSLANTGLSRDYFDGTGADARVVESVLARMAPMGRSMVANDVADVTAFLASEASAYVNGQAVVLDGGFR